jgi:hypothetical protein
MASQARHELVYYFLKGNAPLVVPYFHLAERDKPFVVQQHIPLATQLGMPVATGLLVFLFWRFAFGQQSRSYFGFPAAVADSPPSE